MTAWCSLAPCCLPSCKSRLATDRSCFLNNSSTCSMTFIHEYYVRGNRIVNPGQVIGRSWWYTRKALQYDVFQNCKRRIFKRMPRVLCVLCHINFYNQADKDCILWRRWTLLSLIRNQNTYWILSQDEDQARNSSILKQVQQPAMDDDTPPLDASGMNEGTKTHPASAMV